MLVGATARPLAAQPATPPAGGIAIEFGLAAPADLGSLPRRAIWTTAYIVRLAREDRSAQAVPLLGPTGQPLGIGVSHADFCHAAVEGTLLVTLQDGTQRSLNFAGTGSPRLTDCSDLFPTAAKKNPAQVAAWGSTRFTDIDARKPYGTGGRGRCGAETVIEGQLHALPPRGLPAL
jgi:hypothetical protein